MFKRLTIFNLFLFGLISFPLWAAVTPPSATKPRHLPKELPPPDSINFITHGLRTTNKIALTFDACSTRHPSHYDQRVTEELISMKVPATIFVGGRWAEEEKEHTKFLALNKQFEIGNHTYSHPHMRKVSDHEVLEELAHTQKIVKEQTGLVPTLFRPPYGEEDERVIRLAALLGLTTVGFDLASGDPDRNITKQRLIDYVVQTAKSGSIIVMHINQRGWHTAEALPAIVAGLRKKGFEFVKVSELLHDRDVSVVKSKRTGPGG